MSKLLTVTEAVEYLNISRSTILRWVTAGKIPAFKIGKQWRFRKEDLDAWIESKKNTY